MWKRRAVYFVGLLLTGFIITGCSVHFTTGLDNKTYAKISGSRVGMDIARLLLAEQKYSYENIFDSVIWDEYISDDTELTAEEYVKSNVQDTIEHIVLIKNEADKLNISIKDEEWKNIEAAAAEYMELYSEDIGDFSKNTVEEFYSWLLLADKVFYSCTESVDTEVSSDEARVINVQYIFFSTSKYDADGNLVTVSLNKKNNTYEKAEEVLIQAQNGSDFLTLARNESDDSKYSLELGQGEYNEDFEREAFLLSSGKLTDIVETEYGYYIIKCISDNVESDIDEQKQKVVFNRRKKAFANYYAELVENAVFEINADYEAIDIKNAESGNGQLFEIYRKYFE